MSNKTVEIIHTKKLKITFLISIVKTEARSLKIVLKKEGIMRGRVKWFNDQQGYGFIDYEEGEDVFVHYTAIKQKGYKTLSEGDLVEYDLIKTEKGLQATNVVKT